MESQIRAWIVEDVRRGVRRIRPVNDEGKPVRESPDITIRAGKLKADEIAQALSIAWAKGYSARELRLQEERRI